MVDQLTVQYNSFGSTHKTIVVPHKRWLKLCNA